MHKLYYKSRSIVSLSLIFCMFFSLLPESVTEASTSTRYVWEQFNTTTSTEYSVKETAWDPSDEAIDTLSKQSDDYWFYGEGIRVLNDHNGVNLDITGSYNLVTTQTTTELEAGGVYYFEQYDVDEEEFTYYKLDLSQYSDYKYFWLDSNRESNVNTGDEWYELIIYGSKYSSFLLATKLSFTHSCSIAETSTTVQGETSYGYVSSDSADAYPANDKSGDYWYVYQGTDCIDPASVTYNAPNATTGGDITVSVTPSTQNVYGGTISYTYEYSIDDGSTWTSVGTTEATSKDITVPSDATNFTVRVKASDNYGFTSSTYVYGDTLTVVATATITWNASANGGTIDGENSTVTEVGIGNVAVPPSSNPIKTGYSFKGWYTAESGGSSYADVTVAGDTTYYAQFSANSYEITWDDGQGGEQTTSQAYDANLALPGSPSKAGHTFIGWFTQSSGGTQVSSNTVYTTADSTTYYAQYQVNTYTVTWDHGNGETETSSQVYGTNLVLPSTEPTKENSVFAGWYTAASGGTKVDANTVYNNAGNTTYYGQWAQVFSVTVPAILPVGMGQDGKIYVSENLGIENHSSGDVKVSSIHVSSKNGWNLVPYGTEMANEKVDSKKVGFRINGSDTTTNGTAEYLALSSDWFIGANSDLALDYDAVFSASSSEITGAEVIDVVFVVEWN